MKNSLICPALAITMLFSSARLFAQPCLSAKPAPACRSFFITEIGYGYKINPPLKRTVIYVVGDSKRVDEEEVAGRHYLTSELGLMRNLNSQYALGFTHFTRFDIGHIVRGGVKLRMRRWFNQKTSLDLSGGAILWGPDSYTMFKQPAFIGGASLNFSNWQALNVLIEVLETQPSDYSYSVDGVPYRNSSPRRRNVGVYLGYKLSSKPGLVPHILTLIALGVAGVVALGNVGG